MSREEIERLTADLMRGKGKGARAIKKALGNALKPFRLRLDVSSTVDSLYARLLAENVPPVAEAYENGARWWIAYLCSAALDAVPGYLRTLFGDSSDILELDCALIDPFNPQSRAQLPEDLDRLRAVLAGCSEKEQECFRRNVCGEPPRAISEGMDLSDRQVRRILRKVWELMDEEFRL